MAMILGQHDFDGFVEGLCQRFYADEAGLFLQTFERLAHVSLGFERDRVVVVTVNAPTVSATERGPTSS